MKNLLIKNAFVVSPFDNINENPKEHISFLEEGYVVDSREKKI